MFRPFLPLLVCWLCGMPLAAQLDTILVDSLNQRAEALSAAGDYTGSLFYCQRLDTLFRRALPPGDVRRTEALYGIGTLQYYLGYPDSAALAFRAGADWAEAGDGPPTDLLVQLYNNLAVSLPPTGDLYGARDAAVRALELFQVIGGDTASLELAGRYWCVGMTYQHLQQPREALDYHRSAERVARALPPGASTDIRLGATLCDIGQTYEQLGQYSAAIKSLEEGIALLARHHPDHSGDLVAARNNLSVVLDEVGRRAEGRQLMREVLEQRRAAFGERHKSVAESYNNIAISYVKEERYARALNYQRRALDALPAHLATTPLSGTLYGNLSLIYGQLGDFTRELHYQQRALEVLRATLPPGDRRIAFARYNVGSELNNMGRFGEGLPEIEAAFRELTVHLPPTHPKALQIYDGLVYAHTETGRYALADSLARVGMRLALHDTVADYAAAARLALRLAAPRLHAGNLDSAQYYVDLALTYTARAPGVGEATWGNNYVYRAYLHQRRGDFAAAHRSLAPFRANFGTEEQPSDWATRAAPVEYLKNLPGLIDLYNQWYRATGTAEAERMATYYLREAETGLRYLRGGASDPTGLLPLGRQVGDRALDYHWQAHRLDPAAGKLDSVVAAVERCHAERLRRVVRRAELGGAGLLPDSLTRRMDRLIDERLGYQAVLRDSTTADTLRLRAATRTAELLEAELALRRSNRRAHPDYYAALEQPVPPATARLRARLAGPGRGALAYVVTDSTLYGVLLRSDTTILRAVPVLRDTLAARVARCVEAGIYGYYNLPPARRTPAAAARATAHYTREAQTLYDQLLRPFGPWLTDTLLIVPDDALATLPFEALLSGPPARAGIWRSYPFVLRERQLSYAYALGLQARRGEMAPARNVGWVGMAPFMTVGADAHSRTDVNTYRPAALPHSGAEVRAAAALTGGTGYYGPAADRARFMATSATADVMHLATHAVADTRYGTEGFLVFGDTARDGRLFARELYTRRLPARLVVLSACETALGSTLRGEGLLSLERGFAYAGVPSLVATLWSVDDAATGKIMGDFYTALRVGQPLGTALHGAKQQYLQRAAPELRHPYFWSGVVLRGHAGRLY